MPAPVFEVLAAVKRYGGATALGPITLSVAEGTTIALIGTSGSGKSTLLRLLNGLVTPDAGEVRFQGAPLAGQDLPALRRRIGYVIQGGGLFPHLDAEGNAALVARHLRWEEPRIARRIDELLELVRLPREALSRFPAQLSGGQAQRVGLMRALMLDPAVLLLDEPLGALDPITRFDLQNDLRDAFARLRKTVVLVTHDLSEAAFFAERAVLLRAGAIVQEGRISELHDAPADPFVARFVRAQRPPR
jgi:osmoprotectant transport system ATP-binding protein